MLIDRVLIVGLGSMGRRHVRLARELLPSADIRVLRHQANRDVPMYSDGCFCCVEDAINFSPQIVIIANPAPFHIPIAQAFSQLGAHLLIEKPLSSTVDGILKLISTCNKQGVVLLTGYNLRFLPSLQHFRNLLLGGIVGNILSVRCEVGQYLPSWRPDCDYRVGVTARSELGGGALLELSHEFDYLRWIFGDMNWVQAVLSRQSNLDINVEDTAHLVFGFTPMSDGRQLVGNISLDLIRQDATRSCTAIGDNGSLRWDGLTGVVEIYRRGENKWCHIAKYDQSRDESYRAEWSNFMQSIEGKTKPNVTGEDGLRVLEIIEAVRRSASSGAKVFVATAYE